MINQVSHFIITNKTMSQYRQHILSIMQQNKLMSNKNKLEKLSSKDREEVIQRMINNKKEIDACHAEMVRKLKEQEQKDWDAYINAKPHGYRRLLKKNLHDYCFY
jgi:hypothetical protein